MPILQNQRWELFAQGIAKGLTQGQAARNAGYKDSPSADVHATRLLKRRIQEINEKVLSKTIEKTALTKEWVLDRLRENVGRAMQHRAVRDADGNEIGEYVYNGSVANKALELIGRELQMFVDRKDVNLNIKSGASEADRDGSAGDAAS
jgi:phage terminase small subunit